MGVSCSVRWHYIQYNRRTGQTYTGFQTISLDSDGTNPVNGSTYANTDNDFTTDYIEVVNALPAGYGCTAYVTGCLAGGFLIPVNTPANTRIEGNIINIPGGITVWNRVMNLFDSNNAPTDISDNGKYYEDSSGNWHDITDGSIVATASEVSNLPSGVDFNGWLVDHEIIEGSDGNYYDTNGNQVFENLPSGVIPTSTSASGIFSGSDGNYYDIHGDKILQNLPSGVTPVEHIGNVVKGSDGNYYDMSGNGAMGNLPSGVDIVGYDPVNDTYEGSDGKNYDIDGNEETAPCSGLLLNYDNHIRLTFSGVDIFGNSFSFYKDINPSDNYITLDTSTISAIRKIDRITARPLYNDTSFGGGRLTIFGRVVGFRAVIDIDILDPDLVLGSYQVATCVFSTCDKYATIVLNEDLPLGFVPNTSTLDVGIYTLVGELSLVWEPDLSTEFPYCCGTYNQEEKGSGSTNDNDDADNNDIVEAINKLTDAVKELSCLVEVVVTPAEDVNIYNRRFHYNDRDGVSGFSE